MTFASAIRFTAPLLLAVTLAGCVLPYDDDPYYGRNNYSSPYYGGSYYYGGRYHGGDAYAADPSRPRRTHRRDWRDGDGDLRRRQRAHERPGLEQRHRRAAADRAGSRTGDRTGDRIGDRRRRERAVERPVAERRARRAERQAQERGPAPRRYDDYRGSGETDAAFSRRVESARRQGERESISMERILAGGPVPEK